LAGNRNQSDGTSGVIQVRKFVTASAFDGAYVSPPFNARVEPEIIDWINQPRQSEGQINQLQVWGRSYAISEDTGTIAQVRGVFSGFFFVEYRYQ
jgi:hypothetical protein